MTYPARQPKAMWTLAFPPKSKTKPRYRVPAMSKHRHARMKEYRKVVADLRKKVPHCQWPGCSKPHDDVHHSAGRVGSLLTDVRFLKMLCRPHHNLCKDQPLVARAAGMLCQPGEWNKPVPV